MFIIKIIIDLVQASVDSSRKTDKMSSNGGFFRTSFIAFIEIVISLILN